MGRAYEVRKASIQKTGAVKAKLYSMYAKEIYQAAKSGGTELESNISLKRLVEKAKKDQVPGDLIKRAIDKVNSGVDENYSSVRYEIYGPGGSTLIVDCLTDNVNRTLSFIRPALNKNNGKMGVLNSVSFMYEHLGVLRFKGLNEEQVLEELLEHDVSLDEIENNDAITVYVEPQDFFKAKEVLTNLKNDIEFEVEEVVMLPKEKIVLSDSDRELFERMYDMLEEVEDVSNIYHNVEL